MLGTYFYNASIRKTLSAFGTMLNNISIKRATPDSVIQTIKVPLAYGPAQKFIRREDENTRTDDNGRIAGRIAATWPRMSFELTNIAYDATRKQTTTTRFVKFDVTAADSTKHNIAYAPVPYNIDITLYIGIKNVEDGHQILEQIVPFFTPDFTLTINMLDAVDGKMDIPYILQSISHEDNWDGGFDEKRILTWQIEFQAKTWIWGPVQPTGVIREVIENLYLSDPFVIKDEEIVVDLVPSGATADEDYTTKVTITP